MHDATRSAVSHSNHSGDEFADLIFVSLEDWDEIWRRNQFLCAELSRRFPSRKILFVGQPQFLPRYLKQRTSGGERQTMPWQVPDLPNIWVTSIPKPLPNPCGGRAINEKVARIHIASMARKIGVRDPILWINPHNALYLAGHLGERALIYDITDDWEHASGTVETKARTEAQDRAMCARADLVVVCSQSLLESRRERCRNILLLPNGVDAAHYQAASQTIAKTEWPSPVFGYTGSIHRDRIDFDLVLKLARAFPDGSVVLVGPAFWGEGDNAVRMALDAQSNVHLPGKVAYADVPQTMAHFDVCIVPHRESSFTESLNPIKLWEYLACGKPIVSTNVAGFRDFPQFCRIAAEDDFVESCGDALSEKHSEQGRISMEARREEARGHSWTSRVDVLLDTLRQQKIIANTSD